MVDKLNLVRVDWLCEDCNKADGLCAGVKRCPDCQGEMSAALVRCPNCALRFHLCAYCGKPLEPKTEIISQTKTAS